MDEYNYLIRPCPWPLREAMLADKDVHRKPGAFMATAAMRKAAVARSVKKTTQRWAVLRMLKRMGL